VWPANFALRNADHVLCTNVEDASFVSAMRGRPDEVTFLPNGVDAAFLSNGADRPWDSSLARRLLFLGTWYDRKGIAELATAATRVLDEFSDGHLTVAGCFHSQAVVHACFPNHLHARIEVIPRITDNATLVDVYRRNGIFVLPSYFEGQPLVMLEAAAMGLPIVSTNICGMRDFVEPGRHGWLVPPGDAEALTSAIRRLMASPDEVRTQGNAVRAKVQIYTWENSAVATLAAYERACISASRRARVSEDAVRSNHAAEAKVIGGNTR
jgi:glycosyltransferase involved in cell wall biosynthesis